MHFESHNRFTSNFLNANGNRQHIYRLYNYIAVSFIYTVSHSLDHFACLYYISKEVGHNHLHHFLLSWHSLLTM